MQKLKVLHIPTFDAQSQEAWSAITTNPIDCINWKEYSYHPSVSFKITHNGSLLFIHYKVVEDYPVRTVNLHDQDPVYQDSCVEFFILDNDHYYHNFEFNSSGIALSAKGKERKNRLSRNTLEMRQIARYPSGVLKKNNKYHWSLTIGIPFASVGMARGFSYRANFYKCGDLTQQKHYLSWNNINTQRPDFHCPEYFGEIVIE